MTFEETYLNDNILDALYDMHFEEMTPIQEQCIPKILDGQDLIGVAQTGTGKTAAYLLPILSMLDDGGFPKDAVNCIVMSPTRELAQQIDQAMQGFGYYLDGILGKTSVVEHAEDRQQISRCLACSGLCYTDKVLTVKYFWNTLFLNGCHLLEVHIP